MMASLIEHGIRSPAVLHAMAGVPREEFVLDGDRERAYADRALPIDAPGQTISQPLMVAVVVEALELHRGDRALDVGTGSGYQAAVMAACGAHVVGIERVGSLAETAADRLRRLGFDDGDLTPPGSDRLVRALVAFGDEQAVADRVHRVWVDFIARGEPGWAPYDTASRTTGLLTEDVRVVDDPAGDERAVWAGVR